MKTIFSTKRNKGVPESIINIENLCDLPIFVASLQEIIVFYETENVSCTVECY